MRPLLNIGKSNIYVALSLAFGALVFAGGCQELNTAVDSVLGLGPSEAQAADNHRSFTPFKLAAKKPSERSAGRRGKAAASGGGKVTDKDVIKKVPKGKKRPPAVRAPVKSKTPTLQTEKLELEFPRNPFRPPVDRILPSECPPSMPLCRFDRSQLKLVGIIQVSGGRFKGMVEDPDGRGYFVIAGTQIGGATVTQVGAKGVTLHDHQTGEDIMLPLVKEVKEAREF